MDKILDQLIFERAPWLFKKDPITLSLKLIIYKLLNYKKTLKVAKKIQYLSSEKLLKFLCKLLARRVTISGIKNIPSSGSAIVICNHPTGIADGIMIYHAINFVRPDLFFYANADAIRIFPQLSKFIAPIQWMSDKRSLSSSRETLKFTKAAFDVERLAVIFPSGRLASREGFHLVERQWMTSAVSLAKKYNLPVIPIHIKARNSFLFYLFDQISNSLKDIMLFYEVLNKKKVKYTINIGRSININSLPNDNNEAIKILKSKVLSLNLKNKKKILDPIRKIINPISLKKKNI